MGEDCVGEHEAIHRFQEGRIWEVEMERGGRVEGD